MCRRAAPGLQHLASRGLDEAGASYYHVTFIIQCLTVSSLSQYSPHVAHAEEFRACSSASRRASRAWP